MSKEIKGCISGGEGNQHAVASDSSHLAASKQQTTWAGLYMIDRDCSVGECPVVAPMAPCSHHISFSLQVPALVFPYTAGRGRGPLSPRPCVLFPFTGLQLYRIGRVKGEWMPELRGCISSPYVWTRHQYLPVHTPPVEAVGDKNDVKAFSLFPSRPAFKLVARIVQHCRVFPPHVPAHEAPLRAVWDIRCHVLPAKVKARKSHFICQVFPPQ